MKYLVAVLFSIFLFQSAMAEEVSVRCRGSAPDQDMLFKYEITGDNVTNIYRSHLIVMVGYNNSKDFGWKTVMAMNGKMLVDSPFPQYQALIKQKGSRFDLLLLDPKTGVPIEQFPYDNFTCVVRQ
ncbi:MAG TPA: hypothetical protein VF412_03855 [Bdellovibrio sp.]|uniref:hypothetical protein n=1 Tax=Bdellovibrio sp. TaxID=28201 RepID=UPI002EFBA465